ncbi:short-chain dehydrogenase/reductase SDR [Thermoproteus uzoniensis 768-20]|uniref:Short-chain dehydrogenase/reductase SDR n=1 Tax=Thermoproteus uzoniensis (strain 768-20) TaxID=999630 RepID=F2L1H0_THEU7|nr:SDR family oxidoreductase [Thermoproteus uzoniensis]AEA11640.1 short-chain dehydrogenase/reductase SDR [Thermoproteus uzoniensis 768-20]
MEVRLDGKTVLITGATHGIGEAAAKLFAELGARVVGVGLDEAKGEELKSRGIIFRRVNLAKRDEVLAFVKWFEEEIGVIHVLINNASRNSRHTVLDTELDEWDEMLELNLTAPYLLSKMAARIMISKGIRGKIINVAAIQAHFPLERSFPYVTVKGGLIAMTRSLAVDLGRYGIQAFVVSPGPIYNRAEEAPPDLDRRAATLLGRMGRMREVAYLLAFLASDYNTFITGSEIVIDGGRMISRKPDPEEITAGVL